MESSLRILFLISKSERRLLKNGESGIYARITLNGKRAEVSTGKTILSSEWHQKKYVIGRSTYAQVINESLVKFKGRILKTYNQLLDEFQEEQITAKMIAQKLNGKLSSSKVRKTYQLLEIYRLNNEEIKKQVGTVYALGTYKRYLMTENKLKQYVNHYLKKLDIPLNELTPKFAYDFNNYLTSEERIIFERKSGRSKSKKKDIKKCTNNGSIKYIKQLKRILNKAVEYGWIESSPFTRVKIEIKPNNRKAITEEELRAIELQSFTRECVERTKDIFLFSAYTGISFTDIQKLTTSSISTSATNQKYIVLERQKTSTPALIPLCRKALIIIEKYKEHFYCVANNVLLPVDSNAKTNVYLKEIATDCGINKILTFHIARHTFATIALNNGMSLEVLKYILGHKSTKVTEIYAKMNQNRVFDEFQKYEDSLAKGPLATLEIARSKIIYN